MVRISKEALSEGDNEKLSKQLQVTIGSLNVQQSQIFLQNFFGEEEQIMYAKRLAAILLLSQNYSLYKVANVLHISSSTANRYYDKLNIGEYDTLLQILQKDKKSYTSLLETIDSILHLGGILPHYGQTHRTEAFKKKRGY